MKVAFHTLGCKVNQYETQAMIEQFLARGHELVSEDEFSDWYVINTCSVTNLADRKSRQYIRRMKKVNPDAMIAVTGCYAQISGQEIYDLPEVDIVIGMNEKHLIIDYLEKGEKAIHILPYEKLNRYVETGKVVSMESRTRAYVKVQEGCNRFCSYCIIPYARGPVRSRKVEDVVGEARGLIESGFKEIILTGINTALYGEEGIETLIKEISNIPGDFRIRLSSLEPTVVNADYVKRLLKYPKLCHHLHLSLQSGSDEVLSRMNRRYTRDEYLKIVKVLKDFDPCYGITTDIIVGFPGESEEDFLDSLDMVNKVEFCKVHAFQYSKRPGTKAAQFRDQIPSPVKKERSERLISLGDRPFLEKNIGTVRRVLFEEDNAGYTDNYIKVYVDEGPMGEFADVMLDEIYEDGLKGHIVI
ncbi:MAG: tRNA (N(6)-L-threonylcarbamoyladenosine(37)-C(2))-methylthiotransferase MtaB [Clostridia bacterium]|nr:tRNA (N(6)-L-threonylcarbamoyladenosine(37)-C(2))-methylthiotransferase MtaB [Clostridia bacterium]